MKKSELTPQERLDLRLRLYKLFTIVQTKTEYQVRYEHGYLKKGSPLLMVDTLHRCRKVKTKAQMKAAIRWMYANGYKYTDNLDDFHKARFLLTPEELSKLNSPTPNALIINVL